MFASVAWHTGRECGIQFDAPLAASAIQQLKQRAEWTSVVGITA
jgi:hypothetical protein